MNLLFNQEDRAQIGEEELANIKNEIKMLLKMEKEVYYNSGLNLF